MARIQRFPRLEHPKVGGEIIGKFNGFTIYGTIRKAKKEYSKNRILIQIRQSEPKGFRVAESLAYTRAVDVQFVED
jgi:hypothetical protein